MENFIFSVNATMPLFLVILLGWFLKRIGLLTDEFCRVGNKYVFNVALPASLFLSISKMDLYTDFDPSFCLFCFIATTVCFMGTWALAALFLKDKRLIGAFTQTCCRSSAAILGVGLAVNIYGDVGMVPMMIVAAVPFFNIYAVLILVFSPHVDENGNLLEEKTLNGIEMVKKAALNMMKNPIILGILAGIPFALLRVQFPVIVTSTLSSVGGTASPIALLVVGASFSGGEALKKWKPAAVATFVKLFLLPGLLLPLAAWMGFRDSEMVAILIMSGSPTTVASYIMSKSMKNDGVLTSNVIVLSTLFGSVSITLWLFLLKTFALI